MLSRVKVIDHELSDDHPHSILEFLLDPSLFTSHLRALKTGEKNNPPAPELLRLLLEQVVKEESSGESTSLQHVHAPSTQTTNGRVRTKRSSRLRAMAVEVVEVCLLSLEDLNKACPPPLQREMLQELSFQRANSVPPNAWEVGLQRWRIRGVVQGFTVLHMDPQLLSKPDPSVSATELLEQSCQDVLKWLQRAEAAQETIKADQEEASLLLGSRLQLMYDLGELYFFQDRIAQAQSQFSETMSILTAAPSNAMDFLKSRPDVFNVSKCRLRGFLEACRALHFARDGQSPSADSTLLQSALYQSESLVRSFQNLSSPIDGTVHITLPCEEYPSGTIEIRKLSGERIDGENTFLSLLQRLWRLLATDCAKDNFTRGYRSYIAQCVTKALPSMPCYLSSASAMISLPDLVKCKCALADCIKEVSMGTPPSSAWALSCSAGGLSPLFNPPHTSTGSATAYRRELSVHMVSFIQTHSQLVCDELLKSDEEDPSNSRAEEVAGVLKHLLAFARVALLDGSFKDIATHREGVGRTLDGDAEKDTMAHHDESVCQLDQLHHAMDVVSDIPGWIGSLRGRSKSALLGVPSTSTTTESLSSPKMEDDGSAEIEQSMADMHWMHHVSSLRAMVTDVSDGAMNHSDHSIAIRWSTHPQRCVETFYHLQYRMGELSRRARRVYAAGTLQAGGLEGSSSSSTMVEPSSSSSSSSSSRSSGMCDNRQGVVEEMETLVDQSIGCVEAVGPPELMSFTHMILGLSLSLGVHGVAKRFRLALESWHSRTLVGANDTRDVEDTRIRSVDEKAKAGAIQRHVLACDAAERLDTLLCTLKEASAFLKGSASSSTIQQRGEGPTMKKREGTFDGGDGAGASKRRRIASASAADPFEAAHEPSATTKAMDGDGGAPPGESLANGVESPSKADGIPTPLVHRIRTQSEALWTYLMPLCAGSPTALQMWEPKFGLLSQLWCEESLENVLGLLAACIRAQHMQAHVPFPLAITNVYGPIAQIVFPIRSTEEAAAGTIVETERPKATDPFYLPHLLELYRSTALRLHTLRPDSSIACLAIGDVAFDTGHHAEALRAYLMAIGMHTEYFCALLPSEQAQAIAQGEKPIAPTTRGPMDGEKPSEAPEMGVGEGLLPVPSSGGLLGAPPPPPPAGGGAVIGGLLPAPRTPRRGYSSTILPLPPFFKAILPRMVHSCLSIRARAQAAVLCQFFTPPDFTTAFQALQAEPEALNPMYFEFFWEVPMLEVLAYTFERTGQADKSALLMDLLGRPETNSDNPKSLRDPMIHRMKYNFFKVLCREFLST